MKAANGNFLDFKDRLGLVFEYFQLLVKDLFNLASFSIFNYALFFIGLLHQLSFTYTSQSNPPLPWNAPLILLLAKVRWRFPQDKSQRECQTPKRKLIKSVSTGWLFFCVCVCGCVSVPHVKNTSAYKIPFIYKLLARGASQNTG